MKMKITIEEVITQEFTVEVKDLYSAYDEVRQMYKDGKLVVEDPTLIGASVSFGEDSDWLTIY